MKPGMQTGSIDLGPVQVVLQPPRAVNTWILKHLYQSFTVPQEPAFPDLWGTQKIHAHSTVIPPNVPLASNLQNTIVTGHWRRKEVALRDCVS